MLVANKQTDDLMTFLEKMQRDRERVRVLLQYEDGPLREELQGRLAWVTRHGRTGEIFVTVMMNQGTEVSFYIDGPHWRRTVEHLLRGALLTDENCLLCGQVVPAGQTAYLICSAPYDELKGVDCLRCRQGRV